MLGGAITYSSGFVNGPCALQSPGVLICINNPYPGPGTQIVFITTSTGKMVVANEFSGAPFDTWWRNSGCGVNGSFYAINPDNILFQFSLKTGQIISKVQVQSGVQTPNGMSPNNQGDFVGLWSGDLGRHYYFGTLNSRTGNTVTLNTFPNGYPGPSVFWGMPAVSDLSTGVFYTSSSNVQSGSSYITGLYSFSYNDGRMLNDSLTKFPVVLFSNQ